MKTKNRKSKPATPTNRKGSAELRSKELLAAFVKELETTATSNAEYGYKKLKKREYAAYHHANGLAKAMRWCANKIREIQIAANEKS